MATVVESIAQSLASLATIPQALKAAPSKVADKILEPVSETTKMVRAASTIADRIQSGELERKVDRAVDAAEVYAAASLGLQAVAAFAAIGMLVVQIKSLNATQERRKKKRGRR